MTTLLPRRVSVALASVALVLGVAACGGDDDDAGPAEPLVTDSQSPTDSASTSPSSSPSASAPTAVVTTPTQTGDPLKDAVLKGYIGYVDASTVALEQVDPNLPDLLIYTTGPALEGQQSFINELASRQQRLIGPVTISPEVIAAGDNVARLSDCMDQSQVRTLDASGNVVPMDIQARLPIAADLQLRGTIWQVTAWDVLEGEAC